MRAILFLAVTAAACKDAPDRPAPTNEVWPEAPRPTATTGTRKLRYQPANMPGYRITASGGAPKGAPVRLAFQLALDLRLGAGATPRERDASIGLLDLDVSGVVTMKMRLDESGLSLDTGEGAQHWTRGEPAPFDVAAMVDDPFATLVFDDDRRMTVRAIESHPFAALDMGDMLDGALVLFPELPDEPIAAGQHWMVTRSTPVGASGTRIDGTSRLTYAGDGACPSGTSRCALIELAATSNSAVVDAATVVYAFAGKLFFDVERGILDESHVRLDMNVARGPAALAVNATYVIRPI
ncbi:MAG TPA: hypothetical protein VFS15_10505 [Kofleriaceae bacterium]|nr:hypothetical protein [Kofleriaceae bacterium]